MRIDAFLSEQQVTFEPMPHPPAYSAQMRAKSLGVPGSHVAKSVLLHGPDGFVVAILPATMQVDTEQLGAALGGPIRLATDQEIADVFRDCEWGVVPPFGLLYGLPTLLDESLPEDATLVMETHTHVEAVRLRCRDFVRLEHPRRLRFAKRSA